MVTVMSDNMIGKTSLQIINLLVWKKKTAWNILKMVSYPNKNCTWKHHKSHIEGIYKGYHFFWRNIQMTKNELCFNTDNNLLVHADFT